MQEAISLQRAKELMEKIGIEGASPPMPALRPRIGKEKVKGRNAFIGQKRRDSLVQIELNDPDVRHSGRRNFSANAADPARQTINPEKISLGIFLRHCHQKGPVPTTEIDLDGRIPVKNN